MALSTHKLSTVAANASIVAMGGGSRRTSRASITAGSNSEIVTSEHMIGNTKRRTTAQWEHQELAQVCYTLFETLLNYTGFSWEHLQHSTARICSVFTKHERTSERAVLWTV